MGFKGKTSQGENILPCSINQKYICVNKGEQGISHGIVFSLPLETLTLSDFAENSTADTRFVYSHLLHQMF